jgi:hypothetical protein
MALCVGCLGCSAHVDVGSTKDGGPISPPRDGGRGGSGLAEVGVGFLGENGPTLVSLAVESRALQR